MGAPTTFEATLALMRESPRRWLVTGAAGFIGSNLCEALLQQGQHVVGLDNFATGHRSNLDDVLAALPVAARERFRFIEGDIAEPETCRSACQGIELVLHQAALGSVPRSIATPLVTHRANVDGFLHMLDAAREAGVQRFVYASSSSVYGDHPDLPKVENRTGEPLSPYAVSKAVDELYARVYHRTYGLQTVGLRYFNVFGRRQDPNGAYAAVIPRWIATLLRGEACVMNGDGETSRDFCYIENVIQANLLAATGSDESASGEVYNIAFGGRTTLARLHEMLREKLAVALPGRRFVDAISAPFRPGDVRHSLADIEKARRLLGYEPIHDVSSGLDKALAWYIAHLSAAEAHVHD
jgi:UDP-N-acetylglucosamine 4-epimerase